MIDTTVKPLRPPLAAPEVKLGGRLPSAGNMKPAPATTPRGAPRFEAQPAKIPPPKTGAAIPPASNSSTGHDVDTKPRRPLTCRECRIKAPWPAAGWYVLDRRIVPGSVPPDVLTEAERCTWARLNRQWMGIYCSMTCLRRSMERLEQLDEKFRKQGIGTRLAGTQAAGKTPGGQQPNGGKQ
jgi:hypothetical protein